MSRDTIQLETAVTTISYEYLLEFTSEYGISEALHSELSGLEDRIMVFLEGKNNRFFWVDERVFLTIVNWRTSAPKYGMLAENTYSLEAVMILNTHRTPIQKQLEALLCLVGLSQRYYLGDEVYPTFIHDDDRGQAEGIAVTGPQLVKERHKRGNDGVDTNAPPKVLRRDHVDPRPIESTRGRKSLAAIELGMEFTHPVPASQGAPMDVNDPDLLSFTDPQSRPSADVTYGAAMARDPKSENTSFTFMVSTLQVQVMWEEKLKAAFEEFKQYEDNQVEQRCAEMDARLDALRIDFDEELYPHILIEITSRRWEIGHGLRLAVMKCRESTKLRQAFAGIVSVGIPKGMSEGRKNEVKHGKANLTLEAIEAYDPEVEAKYITAFHALKDLKCPIVDQLGSLKDASMDVIMASLHLKSDTGDDAP
nr:hypothetical protein [Tanacetum cinerariifolium]